MCGFIISSLWGITSAIILSNRFLLSSFFFFSDSNSMWTWPLNGITHQWSLLCFFFLHFFHASFGSSLISSLVLSLKSNLFLFLSSEFLSYISILFIESYVWRYSLSFLLAYFVLSRQMFPMKSYLALKFRSFSSCSLSDITGMLSLTWSII